MIRHRRVHRASHAVAIGSDAFAVMLGDLVRGADLVAVGESHHFVHETFVIRSRVFDVLGRAGFRRAGLELSPHDGRQLDAYLRTGDAGHLDLVGLFGARGPEDLPYRGVLAGMDGSYPHAALRAETTRWLDELRASGVPWSLYGFDVEYLPDLAARHLPRPEDPTERAHVEASLAISRRYDAAVRDAEAYYQLARPMAWREDLMAAHVTRDRARRPAERTVLVGHNLHVGASSDRITLPGAVGPGGGLTAPLGAQLARTGITGPCVWTLHDHGHDSGPPPGTGTVRSVPGTLNAALAELGDGVVALPTTSAPMRRRWRIVSMYGATITGRPADLCDLVISAPTTSSLHDR